MPPNKQDLWVSSARPDRIQAVGVYLEARKSRTRVGRLERRGSGYVFSYDDRYLRMKNGLGLGPSLPLTKKEHVSKRLFPAFSDRIPSKQNPAYKEYCATFGISETETDPFILLPTIGRRGPSSFVFEAVYEDSFTQEDAKRFRQHLGLSVRDFAAAFDVSPGTVMRIETGRLPAGEALKRLEIYARFPQVALLEFFRNQRKLNDRTKENLYRKLSA